jgi:cysteine synthase A
VKEIYDKCAELDRDPHHIIFNQFSEFGNHLAHYLCTGRAGQHVFETLSREDPGLRLRAFVSASGSGGTLGAGDYLKDAFGSLNVVVEALECPTLLYNGFGEHNIQGIGDKHVPLIHNVMNTDVALAVSERSTDALNVLFNTEAGRSYLGWRRKLQPALLGALPSLGLSSICNVLAAIKTAKYYDMDERDVLLTVATDGADLYHTERDLALARDFGGTFGEMEAAEVFARHMLGTATDHLLELSWRDRQRILNLGYFTWVEQQGLSIEEFQARRSQDFWRGLRELLPAWDAMIEEFNRTSA